MHELGVVFHVIESVENIGKENQLTKVPSVTLEVGEVSGVVPSYLTDCWKWAVERSDFMKGAALHFEKIPAVTFCEDCKEEYPTVKHGKTCPRCGSGNTYLLRGNEFVIKEIEAC